MIWRHICSNQIHFVLSRQRHNFAESSAIENTNQSVVHWYFNKPLPKPSILHNTLCGVCNNATKTYCFCCSCFLHRAEPKYQWIWKMSSIKCKRRKKQKQSALCPKNIVMGIKRKKTKKVYFLKNLRYLDRQSNGNVALVSVMLIILKLWKTINCP